MVRISVLGAINWDINLFVERLPRVGEEVPVKKITRVPGGKGGNVAVAAARLLGPGEVALIGCLGNDSIAERQIRILREEGVNISGIKLSDEAESGQAYILIDEKGNNFISTLFGANLHLLPEDVEKPGIYDLLMEAEIITLIDPVIETLEAAASLARMHGKTIMWDAGVRSRMGAKRLRSILENVDYLLVNEVEVKNLTGETNPFRAWQILHKINQNIKLIVKLGERGCSMVGPEIIVSVPSVNLEKIGLKVVNTVGCGDAFLGAFAASKAEGLDDVESLERANLAGALKATKPETRGSPNREEMERYLKYMAKARIIRKT